MRFTLEIEMGDDAMQTPGDVAIALAQTVSALAHVPSDWHGTAGIVRDANGNTVGSWELALGVCTCGAQTTRVLGNGREACDHPACVAYLWSATS